jgi:hypothetical protein
VTHAALKKDNGLVDPSSGSATNSTTPRGKLGSNFAKAVAAAEVETRHQWQDVRVALEGSYGPAKAWLMACALTHDDPSNDCRNQRQVAARTERIVVALTTSAVLVGALGVGVLLFRVRRRRRASGVERRGTLYERP